MIAHLVTLLFLNGCILYCTASLSLDRLTLSMKLLDRLPACLITLLFPKRSIL